MPREKMIEVHIRIPSDMLERLEEEATRKGLGLAGLFRAILAQHLQEKSSAVAEPQKIR